MKFIYDNFDLLFDEAGSVDAFKKLILDMAVRGKLVPQDLGDESASFLIKKIKNEKERLIEEGVIKKENPLPPIKEDEIPFDLPIGWERVVLYDVSRKIHYGYTASADIRFKDIKMLRITDIQNDTVNWSNVPGCRISESDYNKYSLQNMDILIARTGGTVGKSYLVKTLNNKAVFASYLIRIQLDGNVNPDYIKRVLESPLYWKQLIQGTKGTGQPNVNATTLKKLLIPIPPLYEQKRIVQKIDEIFDMIPQLEEAFEKRTKYNRKLNQTSLYGLANVNSRDEFVRSMQFVANNFDSLYGNIENVKELRQAILTLALQGKLVPQDPNDEPASTLVERITKEKESLIQEGVLKKEKPLPPIKAGEMPFELPGSWLWSRLGTIATYGQSSSIKPDIIKKDAWILELEDIEKNSSKLLKRINLYERNSKSTKNCFNKGDVLYGKLRPYLNKVIVADQSGYSSSEIVPIKTYDLIMPKYLMYSLKQKDFFDYVNRCNYGTKMPRLGTEDARKALIPVPPLNEQKLIVEKIDKLMVICDDLENRIAECNGISDQLLNAFLHEAFADVS